MTQIRSVSAKRMVRAFKQESGRQRALIMKAAQTERQLLFIVSALEELFDDANFVILLQAEGLDTLPLQIADLIHQEERAE